MVFVESGRFAFFTPATALASPAGTGAPLIPPEPGTPPPLPGVPGPVPAGQSSSKSGLGQTQGAAPLGTPLTLPKKPPDLGFPAGRSGATVSGHGCRLGREGAELDAGIESRQRQGHGGAGIDSP